MAFYFPGTGTFHCPQHLRPGRHLENSGATYTQNSHFKEGLYQAVATLVLFSSLNEYLLGARKPCFDLGDTEVAPKIHALVFKRQM